LLGKFVDFFQRPTVGGVKDLGMVVEIQKARSGERRRAEDEVVRSYHVQIEALF
jgi:hypothetical protein